MNILAPARPFNEARLVEALSDADRREDKQPSERLIGRVISCNGARAIIATSASDLSGAKADFWSIGRLISINLGESRVVCLVYEMKAAGSTWDEGALNTMFVNVELVGEVINGDGGGVSFRKGITRYPHLGAHAHRIRVNDLKAIYDPGKRSGVVEIGRLSQDESVAAMVSIDDMLSRHFAVVGTTGVGKSSSVTLLLRKAVEVKPNLRVLILDPHNEFASAFPESAVVIEATTLELPIWLFRFEEIADVLFRGRSGIEEEQDILRDMIAQAKARFKGSGGDPLGASVSLLRRPSSASGTAANGMTADTPVPYRMTDMFQLMDELLGQLEPRYDKLSVRSLKYRLEALAKDPRYAFMFGAANHDDNMDRIIGKIFRIPHLGRPISVFQLAGLPSEVVNAVASVLSRMAFDLAMWSAGAYEILLLCEEAHRYVPADPSLGFWPTRQAIARIAKEGRKYGCYLGVITQRPGELDPTILSQCSTLFAMRLGNDHDQEIIRSAISSSSASTISFLSSIGNREAIAFGEGISTPMRMMFAFQPQHLLPATAAQAGNRDKTGPREINLREVISRMRGQLAVQSDI